MAKIMMAAGNVSAAKNGIAAKSSIAAKNAMKLRMQLHLKCNGNCSNIKVPRSNFKKNIKKKSKPKFTLKLKQI